MKWSTGESRKLPWDRGNTTKKENDTMRKRSVSKKAGTKGKGRLRKGFKYLKGGRIVKVKSR